MLFDIINALAMVIWIVMYVFYGRHYGFSKLKSLFISVFSCVVTYMFIFVLYWICSGFKYFGAQNAVRAYSTIVIVFWLETKIFKVDFRTLCDYQSIWPILWFGLGHIACIFEGCCHSFHYEEGTTVFKIAHALTGTDMLPVQAMEAFGSLILALILIIVHKKKNYNTGGRLFFYGLIAYAVPRFFMEFLRDNDKLIEFGTMPGAFDMYHDSATFGISELALWAIVMIVESVIFLVIFDKQDKKKALEAK